MADHNISVKSHGAKQLETELGRSRIYQAVVEHLQSIGVRPGSAFDWNLEFDLHFGLEPSPERPL
jgi:hypothetical protein